MAASPSPSRHAGYRVKITANVPDLTGWRRSPEREPLPPLHDIGLAAQVADAGAALPDISSLTLHVGASDLTSVRGWAQA